MENTIQVQNIMKITDDVKADEALEEIRDIRAEASRLTMIANSRVENINQQLKASLDKLSNEEQFLMDQLRAYALNLKFKETKTQKTYNLLSGKLIIKKPTKKVEVGDRKKLIQYAEGSAKDYVKVKTETDVDWAGLKEVLDIDGDKIINKETGEVLGELEGLTVKEIGEIFDIKL